MSKTVVRKQRRKRAGAPSPRERAEQCDHEHKQLRIDFYRRDMARRPALYADGWTPPGLEARTEPMRVV